MRATAKDNGRKLYSAIDSIPSNCYIFLWLARDICDCIVLRHSHTKTMCQADLQSFLCDCLLMLIGHDRGLQLDVITFNLCSFHRRNNNLPTIVQKSHFDYIRNDAWTASRKFIKLADPFICLFLGSIRIAMVCPV